MNGLNTTYTKQVTLDRTNHLMVYVAAEDDLYISNNGGANWNAAGVGVAGIKCIFQHPVKHDILYVGTEDHGVYSSMDRGRVWKPAVGFPQSAVYAISSSQDGRAIYAAGFRTGLWKSEDNGATWRQIWLAPGIDAIYTIFVHPDHPNHLMIGTNGKGMFESVDSGASWRHAGFTNAHIRQIALFPN
jgi:photosystem II stability/assembly factor-like uncharacterized protein